MTRHGMDNRKLCIILYLCFIQVLSVKIKLEEHSDTSGDNNNNVFNITQDGTRMDPVLYKTMKKYACLKNNVEGSHILVYGEKGWTFPQQDISLSLVYPPENSRISPSDEFDNYLITGFQVILYMDGGDSRGFITKGGIYNSTIQLTFECKNVTTIGYQFLLYGITKITHNVAHQPSNTYINMC